MTEQQRQQLEMIFPNCLSEERINHADQMALHFIDHAEQLAKDIAGLTDDCLYTLAGDCLGRTYRIEKQTPKRVYACLHEDHRVRTLERLVLNRHQLERTGYDWHRGTYQTLYTSEAIHMILGQKRDRACSSVSAYLRQFHEMSANYGESGVALTDEEYRMATTVFGIAFDEWGEPEPVCTATHNWLEEGF